MSRGVFICNRRSSPGLSSLGVSELIGSGPTRLGLRFCTVTGTTTGNLESLRSPIYTCRMAEPSAQHDRRSLPRAQPRDLFVGRQREMETLTTALEDCLAGRGQMVMLAGEPGIGKTRTAKELAAHAEDLGVKVLWGWFHDDEGAPPYWPWIEMIRSYVQHCDPGQLRSEMGLGAASIADAVLEIQAR